MNLSESEMEQMIENNMGLVYSVLQKQFPAFQRDEEYIQMGRIGLWRALRTYDPSKGGGEAAFSSYIHVAVYRSINWFHRGRAAAKQYKLNPISLNQPFGDGVELGDMIASNYEFEKDVDAETCVLEIGKKSKRAEEMIRMYADGYTFSEIGQAFNITKQRAQMICAKCQKYFKEEL